MSELVSAQRICDCLLAKVRERGQGKVVDLTTVKGPVRYCLAGRL